MAASKGMAKAKGYSGTGGRREGLSTVKNPHTQIGNKDKKGRGR